MQMKILQLISALYKLMNFIIIIIIMITRKYLLIS